MVALSQAAPVIVHPGLTESANSPLLVKQNQYLGILILISIGLLTDIHSTFFAHSIPYMYKLSLNQFSFHSAVVVGFDDRGPWHLFALPLGSTVLLGWSSKITCICI